MYNVCTGILQNVGDSRRATDSLRAKEALELSAAAEAKAALSALRASTHEVSDANGVLDERMEDPDSVQNIMDIAKEELGLVDPDTVLIEPQS